MVSKNLNVYSTPYNRMKLFDQHENTRSFQSIALLTMHSSTAYWLTLRQLLRYLIPDRTRTVLLSLPAPDGTAVSPLPLMAVSLN